MAAHLHCSTRQSRGWSVLLTRGGPPPLRPTTGSLFPWWLATGPTLGCGPRPAPGPVAMATLFCRQLAAFGYLDLRAQRFGGVAGERLGRRWGQDGAETPLSARGGRGGGGGSSARIGSTHCVVRI